MNARILVAVLAVAGYAAIAHVLSTTTRFSFSPAWIFFAQDSALNAGLALLFGTSLRVGETPLCTRIALLLQNSVSEKALRYTRAVTWTWTLFFGAMIAISALLFFRGERATWSLFANVLYWPLLSAMFVSEYAVRVLLLPRADRTGFFATIGAFQRLHRARDRRASALT